MKKITLAVFVILMTWVISARAAENFNLKDFGGIGDGATLNTTVLQKAIDACTEAGGGVIRIPSGRYVIGTVEMKSDVTLSLDHGAELLGSQKMEDYPTHKLSPAREGQSQCLFYAKNATNIRLEGLGVIDGRGSPDHFPRRAGPRGRDTRPRLFRFENCENLAFSGLTYKNPAFWGIHLIDCRKVHFTGVTVRMRNNNYNNDGLDLDGCEDVHIENCDIDSGDDGICLKSSKNPCRKIVVRNCKVSSNTAALKFGSSSHGGFIDIDVSNCYFYDCPMGAIKLQSVDGGRMENVSISRIQMDEVGSPIFIRLGNRGHKYTKNNKTGSDQGSDVAPENTEVGTIKNIRISDVVAKVTIEDREKTAEALYKKRKVDRTPGVTEKEKAKAGPIMITGIPGYLVEDIVLENIEISYPGHGTEDNASREVPEDIAKYPEQYFFGVLPAWGAYIRHAKNIEFKNVTMTLRGTDQRKKLVLDDVEDFEEN